MSEQEASRDWRRFSHGDSKECLEEQEAERRRVELALEAMGDGFRQFSRNGRWGTCTVCPTSRGVMHSPSSAHTQTEETTGSHWLVW